MKRKYLILFILLLIINSNIKGQNKDEIRENYFGFSAAGTTYSTFTDLNFKKYTLYPIFAAYGIESEYFYGWSAGISYKNFREKIVGLMIELNYTKKGGYNQFNYDINMNDSLSLLFYQEFEYIELPFMMNLRFGWDKLKLNFYGGPHIGWLINQDFVIYGETGGREYKDKVDFNFEFGINGGGGISYQIGNHHMVEIGLRYSHGITNIFKYETINSSIYNQNQVLSANAHYYYRF